MGRAYRAPKETLRHIVGDHVRTRRARVLGSHCPAPGLAVSPATVRNEMAVLEERGYISTRTPPPAAYLRTWATAISFSTCLAVPSWTLESARKSRTNYSAWNSTRTNGSPMAATLLARSVHSAAVVTPPKATGRD